MSEHSVRENASHMCCGEISCHETKIINNKTIISCPACPSYCREKNIMLKDCSHVIIN